MTLRNLSLRNCGSQSKRDIEYSTGIPTSKGQFVVAADGSVVRKQETAQENSAPKNAPIPSGMR